MKHEPYWKNISSGAIWLRRVAPDTWPIVALIFLPILVQLPEILGWLIANPMGIYSGLGYNIKPGLIAGLSSTDPNIGFTSQALGHRAALDWLSGHIPWWNPYEGVGTPLAGEMQSAALFPLTLLLVFQNGQLYFHITLEILAGLSTYFLLRQLKLSKTAAITGGILFEFNGTFALLANATVNPVPFLPMLLLGIEWAFIAAQEKRSAGWRLIAVSLALSLYAGFPETAYINGLFAAGWVLIRVFQAKGIARTAFFRKVLLGGFVGLALSAPIIVAFVGFLKNALVGGHNGGFAFAHLPKEYLAMLIMPNLFGNINAYSSYDKTNVLAGMWGGIGGYLGIALFVFAIFGLFGHGKRGLRLFCGGWIAITLLKTFDIRLFTNILNLIPLIKESAFFRYVPPSWELAAIILGSFALDDLRSKKAKKSPGFALNGIFSLGFVLTIITLCARKLIIELAPAPRFFDWIIGSWGLAALVIVSIIVINAHVSADKRRIGLLSGVMILSSLTPFLVSTLANQRNVDINQGGITYLQEHQGFNRFYTLGPIEPNYGSYYGISSINHNDLPVSSTWVKYLSKNLDRYADSISFTGNVPRPNSTYPDQASELRRNLSQYEEVGVKYVVAPAGKNPFIDTMNAKAQQSGTLQPVYKDNVMDIYELPHPKPYFEVLNGAAQVQSQSRTELSVSSSSPTQLIRRELYFPGWQATVNNKPVSITPFNGLFQEISLPVGDSQIRYWYTPPFINYALLALALALAVIAGSLVRDILKRRKI